MVKTTKPLAFVFPRDETLEGINPELLIQRRITRANLKMDAALCTYKFGKSYKLLNYNTYREILSRIGMMIGCMEHGLTPHVARISAATIASIAGMSKDELKLVGNWMTDKSVDTYVRLTVGDVTKAQAKLVKHLKLGGSD